MRAARASFWAAMIGMAVVVVGGRAQADADPAFGYLYGSYAVPYGANWAGAYESGGFQSAPPVLGVRTRPWLGMENAAFGFGIGYDGLNAQLDIRNVANLTAGALTFGWRLNFQFGNLELWTRVGAGPLVALDFTNGLTATGGIATMLEAGLDYFIVKEFVAVGVKAIAVPTYRFPLALGADIDLNAGLRIIL